MREGPRISWLLALVWMAAMALPAHAADASATPLKLCVQDQPFYPYILPGGKGSFQRLTTQAVAQLPVQLSIAEVPWPRCLRRLQDGQFDGAIGGWTAERTAFAVFPMKNGVIDPQRYVGAIRFAVYRRKGSMANWDGKQFRLPAGATVGVQRGFSFGETLKASGVPIDAHSTSASQLLDKLAHGRNDLVIVQKAYGDLALQEPKLAGLIEQLPLQYAELDIYLMLSKPFQAAHPDLVEQIWNAIKVARRPHG